jgi:hypothetical protein
MGQAPFTADHQTWSRPHRATVATERARGRCEPYRKLCHDAEPELRGDRNLPTVAEQSWLGIVGTVTKERAWLSEDGVDIFTDVTVQVEKVLKGTAQGSRVVIVPGGCTTSQTETRNKRPPLTDANCRSGHDTCRCWRMIPTSARRRRRISVSTARTAAFPSRSRLSITGRIRSLTVSKA